MNDWPRYLLRCTDIAGRVFWVGRKAGQSYLSNVDFRQDAAPLSAKQVQEQLNFFGLAVYPPKIEIIEMGIRGLVK